MDNSQGRLQDFREYIERIFLQDPEIFAFDSTVKSCPPVASFNYENVPEQDYITSITFGVSEFNNPEWTEGRPELMLTVQSTDMNWGKALAFIGAELIEEHNFEYGEVIHFGNQISEESKMTSFFVFAPSILESEDYENIKIEDRNINLVALYPIYKEEEETIEAVGLEEFMKHPSYDMYSVTRAPIIIGSDQNKWLPSDWSKN